jgi:hypothetical protein
VNCYRVWMKDGYASLVNAESEIEARSKAAEVATNNVDGLAMTPKEKRDATTVERVENLSKDRR